MNEVQRQAYLRVMGIQTYFPKSALPGAKQSPSYEIPLEQLAKLPVSATARQGRVRVSNPQSPALTQSKRGVVQKAAEGVTQTSQGRQGKTIPQERGQAEPLASLNALQEEAIAEKAPVAETLELVEKNELRFKLRYFRINEKLAVIDEVPHQKSERLNRDDQALLKVILAALKQETSELDLRAESFSWPLVENMAMINDPAEEAARALSGFIQMRQETDGFANLLVFAAQADNLFLQREGESDIRDFAAENSTYFITVSHSLHSILAYPALKRDVWQHLQPLRRRLAEENSASEFK